VLMRAGQYWTVLLQGTEQNGMAWGHPSVLSRYGTVTAGTKACSGLGEATPCLTERPCAHAESVDGH
jgi:hypothetical protein